MLKRFLWCTIWILSVVLVCASLDSTPDPPALDPHARIVKIVTPNNGPQSPDSHFEYDNSPGLIAVQTSVILLDTDPQRPIAILAETRQATDTSPPA